MISIMKKRTMIFVLAAVFILAAILTGGRMLYPQNLSNLLLQNAYVIVLACGMLLCILTGGNIDLSVGATACLVGAVAAQFLSIGMNWFVVIVLCLLLGLLIGIWNGFWIGKFRVPSFVCTLAGMFMFIGLARVILDSRTMAITDNHFLDAFASYIQVPGLDDGPIKWSCFIVGAVACAIIIIVGVFARAKRKKKMYDALQSRLDTLKYCVIAALVLVYTWVLANYKGIPVMAIWVVVIVAVYAYVTANTPVGRYFYAVGNNEKAVKLSGINTDKVLFLAYASMSFLAGLSGLLIAARIGSVNGDTGNAFEMDAIAACFIGGASAYGGSGTIPGILVGAVLLGVINQGMSILGLDSNWQYVIKGAVLLAAVIFEVAMNRKKAE